MTQYKHFLVATDLELDNDELMEKASYFAKCFDAKLSLVHVVHPITANAYGFIDMAEYEQEAVKNAKEELSNIGSAYHINADNQHVLIGYARDQILELSEKISADAIIIGSHGRHGFSALLGSTANSVAHHADKDVILIRVHKK